MSWYIQYYRRARSSGKYRLYLLYNDDGAPVAYGALFLEEERLLVTECVATNHRGKGYGRSIIDNLINIALQERRDLVAEIWASNKRSIVLHERVGFRHLSTNTKDGEELRTYILLIALHRAGDSNTTAGSKVIA